MNRRTILPLALLLIAGCGGETSSSVFKDAKQVIIASPQQCKRFLLTLGESDDVFTFGSEQGALGLTEQRIFAAVFEEFPPQVQDGKIINSQDAVWVWHSGMRSNANPAAGKVRFTDGTGVNADGTPAALEACRMTGNCSSITSKLDRATGKTYFFAVWAWNEEREISYFSDTVMPFCFTLDEAERGQDCPAACSNAW
ncbi:MAG TPA: hypothetical protein DFS52_08025 [Myxococcales bacterium]|jgi:hypothetical protein|nr:hypothetical protein [Myxococcales bacterium]